MPVDPPNYVATYHLYDRAHSGRMLGDGNIGHAYCDRRIMWEDMWMDDNGRNRSDNYVRRISAPLCPVCASVRTAHGILSTRSE